MNEKEAKLIRSEQEAIECLKSNRPKNGYYMLKESMDMAIEALEKQVEKKPCLEGDGCSDGEIVYDTWYCPSCEQDYELDTDGQYDYCPNCGQKIDWSELNDI